MLSRESRDMNFKGNRANGRPEVEQSFLKIMLLLIPWLDGENNQIDVA